MRTGDFTLAALTAPGRYFRFEKTGTLAREKQGRRNRHQILKEQSLRHRLESQCTMTSLLTMVLAKPRDGVDRVRADADLSEDLGAH